MRIIDQSMGSHTFPPEVRDLGSDPSVSCLSTVLLRKYANTYSEGQHPDLISADFSDRLDMVLPVFNTGLECSAPDNVLSVWYVGIPQSRVSEREYRTRFPPWGVKGEEVRQARKESLRW